MKHRLTLRSYITGFASSVLLTLAAYMLVTQKLLDNNPLTAAIIGLALVQFVVQVLYFLHLAQEKNPRWRLVVFAFMLQTVVIVIFGTLWIMANLDYHHNMAPEQINQTIIHDEGITPKP